MKKLTLEEKKAELAAAKEKFQQLKTAQTQFNKDINTNTSQLEADNKDIDKYTAHITGKDAKSSCEIS